MKNSATVICCIALAFFGSIVGYNNPPPVNTVNAEPVELSLPKDLCRLVHDTVTVTETVRDTLRVEKVKYKTKYRVKHVTDTVEKEVPVLYTRTCGNRKEQIPDTILTSKPKVVRKVIELRE